MEGRRGARTVVGALGAKRLARVDEHGAVEVPASGLLVDWWIGAEDRWRIPGEEPGTRQRLLGAAPVVTTVVPVPSGEAHQCVYGVAGPMPMLVVEVENASPAPFALAVVLRPAAVGRRGVVTIDGATVAVGGAPAVVVPRAPLRWAAGEDVRGGVRGVVTTGGAHEGPFVPARSKRIRETALLYPVAHRTRVRFGVLLADRVGGQVPDLAALPGAEEVRAGWEALLGRAMRTELPEPLQSTVEASRAALLLLAGATTRPDADVVVALEDWGFDDEAAAAWARLGTRARRAASRRDEDVSTPWVRAASYLAAASPTRALPGGPAPFLRAVREVLVEDHGDEVDVVPGFPTEWLGADLAVHDVPLRAGLLSFALRWHGERPALLWDAPAGVTLRAPALDPGFSGAGGRGETLLAAPGATLLALRPAALEEPAGEGVAGVDEPGPAAPDGPESFT